MLSRFSHCNGKCGTSLFIPSDFYSADGHMYRSFFLILREDWWRTFSLESGKKCEMVNKTLGIFRAWDSISPIQMRSKGQQGCAGCVEETQNNREQAGICIHLAKRGNMFGLQCWCGQEQSQCGGALLQCSMQQVCNSYNHQQSETGVKPPQSITWVYPYHRIIES